MGTVDILQRDPMRLMSPNPTVTSDVTSIQNRMLTETELSDCMISHPGTASHTIFSTQGQGGYESLTCCKGTGANPLLWMHCTDVG